jgi:Cysteine-rich CPCC
MYPCPVCGYIVFAEPPGSYDVCPICNWEDDALQLEFATTLSGGANPLTLLDSQRQYARKAERLRRDRGVAVMPRDQDPAWRPIDSSLDSFPDWSSLAPTRAPAVDDCLYYWRDTFWHRAPAS